MIVLDRLLIGGIRFVLDKVAQAAERELNDDALLRERLLEAQMRAEIGELDEAELAAIEAEVLARLRTIQEARREGSVTMDPLTTRVAGVEASFDESSWGDDGSR